MRTLFFTVLLLRFPGSAVDTLSLKQKATTLSFSMRLLRWFYCVALKLIYLLCTLKCVFLLFPVFWQRTSVASP